VLAVDQGTSGTKALVVSPDRGVLSSAEVAVEVRYGADGLVEVDPAALLHSVVEAGRRALDAAGETVQAVGLANQGETVLVWDRASGRPLSPGVVWQDRRAASVCERLAADGDRLRERTGLTLDPYFAAPKMTWLREHVTRAGVVTTSDAWLVHQLCGAFVTDASTASRTLLLDLDDVAWSRELLDVFDLGDEELPEVVDAAGVVGTTTAFGPELPVAGLLVDQQAALLAQRCLAPGDAKCTYGTGAFLLAQSGAVARRSAAGLVACVAWRLGGRTSWCLDGQVFTAASAVRWLADVGVIEGAVDLDRLGLPVDDAGGVTFVPVLAGLAAPWWRSDVRAAVTGIGLGTTRGHLVRALCEGVAAQVVALADAVAADLGRPLEVLRVDGGLTRSRLLMQTQADLLQVPVEVFGAADATALGVAAAARMGLDPTLQPQDAIVGGAPAATYEPRIPAGVAADRVGRHRGLVELLLGEVDVAVPQP
jgi:glycerol kinase